jgi:hypothetical protein
MRGKRTARHTRPLRSLRSRNRRTRKMKGGFVPSVMGNFLLGASKYITPLALFAGYKLYMKTKNMKCRRTKRSRK